MEHRIGPPLTDAIYMKTHSGRQPAVIATGRVMKILFTALLLSLGNMLVHAAEARLAVAANFAAPALKIAAEFEKQTGHKAIVVAGATGKFYAQIANGAPFDILLAADAETPARLEKEAYSVVGTRYTYAIGKLVLWSPKPAIVDDKGEVLKRGGFNHLSIANPKVSPYGSAAVETLKALGVRDALQSRLVMGENIAQTYQFVATGNALLGFVALSQVLGKSGDGSISGSFWIVPEQLHSPIRQDATLLAKGRHNQAAAAFLDYLRHSPKAREIILAYGYSR